MNWQHGDGGGSAEQTIAFVAVIVVIAIVVWRVVVFLQAHPEILGG